MTEAELQLWNKIQAFQLDNTNDAFQFSHRLAAENGWTRTYTLRVIEEYKRFLFLCCVSSSPVTPSDAVDQAWHLHLTYTRSYWQVLCKQVLQRDIHHEPTKGGKAEATKFNNLYTLLHKEYSNRFGERPPEDIWLENKLRFKQEAFQRVNTSDYWLIKKPAGFSAKWLGIPVLIAGALFFIQATGILFFMGVFVMLAIILKGFSSKGKGTRRSDDGGTSEGGDSTVSGASTWDNTATDNSDDDNMSPVSGHHSNDNAYHGCSSSHHSDSADSSSGCSSHSGCSSSGCSSSGCSSSGCSSSSD